VIPDEFHDLAVNLIKNGDCEASVRSSASRCYYAAFLQARLLTEDITLPGSFSGGSHVEVSEKVKRKYGSPYADLLKSMKKTRNEADYDIAQKFPKAEAQKLMLIRRKLLDAIDT
jgi:uncharacterized protein (UPF0332 family)